MRYPKAVKTKALGMWDTHTIAEIARTVGAPRETVRSWGHRAGKPIKQAGRPPDIAEQRPRRARGAP